MFAHHRPAPLPPLGKHSLDGIGNGLDETREWPCPRDGVKGSRSFRSGVPCPVPEGRGAGDNLVALRHQQQRRACARMTNRAIWEGRRAWSSTLLHRSGLNPTNILRPSLGMLAQWTLSAWATRPTSAARGETLAVADRRESARSPVKATHNGAHWCSAASCRGRNAAAEKRPSASARPARAPGREKPSFCVLRIDTVKRGPLTLGNAEKGCACRA